MLWESPSECKEDDNKNESGTNTNPLLQNVAAVLLPTQSGTPPQYTPPQGSVPVVVPDIEELKEQFQLQQHMLTQIKETIMENESELNSKGKKVEAYASRLAEIRARTKKNDSEVSTVSTKPDSSPVKTLTKKPSKENLTKENDSPVKTLSRKPSKENLAKENDSPVKTLSRKPSKENLAKENDSPVKTKSPQGSVKLTPKAKYIELKKKLEESKIKFEERTGKEVSETKKIESIVQDLKVQIDKRDATIQELQKIAEQPSSSKSDASTWKSKAKTEGKPISSKSTQTTNFEPNDESVEIMALQNKIYELEESLKEKESVIYARTQAVTLLSQDLSLKGKNTLECLEETRKEMRAMQNNFIIIENQLKKELVEKDERLVEAENKLKNCESVYTELKVKNAGLFESLIAMEKRYLDLEAIKTSSSEPVIQLQDDDQVSDLNIKISDLNKELDDLNKSMIKMKLEHKNKTKNLNRIIEKLKGESDDKAEIIRLQTLVDEFEVVKETQQNKIAELEEEKATENSLKDIISKLEAQIKEQTTAIQNHLQTICNIQKEKFDMFQSAQDQNILIENLYAKIQSLEFDIAEKDVEIRKVLDKLRIKTENLDSLQASIADEKYSKERKITSDLNNAQVEEQIEILVKEKQQLLDKLKNLSGVSSTDSFTFETVEHSDLEGQTETTVSAVFCEIGDIAKGNEAGNEDLQLQRVIDEQQTTINDLQNAIKNEKEKTLEYKKKLEELEKDFKSLENANKQLNSEPTEENEDSKSSKPNANVKYKIKEIQTELAESRKTIQLQNEKLEELNLKLEEKEQLIKNYIEKIELFERDDWGRENDWKATQDELEHMRELQKKCLSLENNLIELTEDCERLRKENIEVVHMLSEEKVKRKKLMEKFNVEDYGSLTSVELNESRPESVGESSNASVEEESAVKILEERLQNLIEANESLENRLEVLEMQQNDHSNVDNTEDVNKFKLTINDLQEKLEWSNIVLTSKETEIFKLQSSLEHCEKTIEDLQRDYNDVNEKLRMKDLECNKICDDLRDANDEKVKLKDMLKIESERILSLEVQVENLVQTNKDLEADSAKKERALSETNATLTQKKSEVVKLEADLKKLDRELTIRYEDRLENMEKCLRASEEKCREIILQHQESDESKWALKTMNEELKDQIKEKNKREEELLDEAEDRERIIRELSARINELLKKESRQNNEDVQMRLKKLTFTLKKKVQTERDLMQQIQQQEVFMEEKDKMLNKMMKEFNDVNEKLAMVKEEKDQLNNGLATVSLAKSAMENEIAELRQKLKSAEIECEMKLQKSEYKIQQMETQLQKMYENSERMRLKQEQDKELAAKMEFELTNSLTVVTKDNEELRRMLEGISKEYEEKKLEVNKLSFDKLEVDNKLLQAMAEVNLLKEQDVRKEGKIVELISTVESLKYDLNEAACHLKRSEEKLSFMEEVRSSLEKKTENMLKRIEEDSEKLLLLDNMSSQIQALNESKQNLKSAVKSLDDKNKELELEIKELQAGRSALENELAEYRQKLSNANGELEKFRELDREKAEVEKLLSAESERLKSVKMESKQKSLDIEKLQNDIDMLEADLKESIENSKSVEKSLSRKIEELTQENASLTEKIKDLSETKENQEDKVVKRKKSVTFKTDETSYIHDLKSKIHDQNEEIKKYEEEISDLKMELLREKLRTDVTEVVSEAKEKVESLKSSPEKKEPKFDANVFFGEGAPAEESLFFDQQVEGSATSNTDHNQVDYDSLVWDSGWGTEGHLEEQYLSSQTIAPNQEKYDLLEKELKTVEEGKNKMEEEYQQLQMKYAKVIKKMKEQKITCEQLQTEVNKLKSDAGFGGLDGAIMDELKSQISAYEQKEKELIKSLESSKAEKEGLLKRIDILNAGNEKLLEMKERHNEIEIWENKNRELLDEINKLREELRDKEKELSVDESELVRELKNKIEGLEWENCELKESLEEKLEMFELQNESMDGGKDEKLAKEIEELQGIKQRLENRLADEETRTAEIIEDLQLQITALASENETLQEILIDIRRTPRNRTTEQLQIPRPETETRVFDYFKTSPINDPFSSITNLHLYREPVTEPMVESKVAVEASTANSSLERELQNVKQENELLQLQLGEVQSLITAMKSEHDEKREKYREEYESTLSFHLEEKNNALQKVYELEQALAIKIEELNNMSLRMRNLDQTVPLRMEELNTVSRQRQQLEEALEMKSEELTYYLVKISELEETLEVKTEELMKSNAIQVEVECELRAKLNELNKATNTVSVLEEKLRIREEEGYKILTELNRLTSEVHRLEEECAISSASLENVQRVNENLQRNAELGDPEIEELTRLLSTERSTVEQLRRLLEEKEEVIKSHTEEIKDLKNKLDENEVKLNKTKEDYEKVRTLMEDYCNLKETLEDAASNLRIELHTANMELMMSKKELEELRKVKDEEIAKLESEIKAASKIESEIKALKEEMALKTEEYEKQLSEKESTHSEEMMMIQRASKAMQAHIETLKADLREKDNDIFELGQTLDEEQKQLNDMRALLETKDAEITDLRKALNGFEEEIKSFRNFEKQVKELRLAQMGSNAPVTARGDPDFTKWTEHELTELSTRLQSDLDSALYMLHQRDIRCEELTFELMQLLEERDTLQLRLSTVIRINEELRRLTSAEETAHLNYRHENKDVVDQSNDRQVERAAKVQEEDFKKLAQKISELHSVGYMKDKTIQDETARRHRDQMTLLGRVSDTDLGRESQSSVANWIRTGKTSPKVMHV